MTKWSMVYDSTVHYWPVHNWTHLGTTRLMFPHQKHTWMQNPKPRRKSHVLHRRHSWPGTEDRCWRLQYAWTKGWQRTVQMAYPQTPSWSWQSLAVNDHWSSHMIRSHHSLAPLWHDRRLDPGLWSISTYSQRTPKGGYLQSWCRWFLWHLREPLVVVVVVVLYKQGSKRCQSKMRVKWSIMSHMQMSDYIPPCVLTIHFKYNICLWQKANCIFRDRLIENIAPYHVSMGIKLSWRTHCLQAL